MGSFGVGKLFFINIVIIVLMGEYKFYVDVCFGSKYNIIRIYRYVMYEMRWIIEKILRGVIGLKKWIFGV